MFEMNCAGVELEGTFNFSCRSSKKLYRLDLILIYAILRG